jgi:hypothetical protein
MARKLVHFVSAHALGRKADAEKQHPGLPERHGKK